MKTIADRKAMLTNTRNDTSVEVEIDNFREEKHFDAFIATNKIPMKWNGKVYVGNAHGMEFISDGPTIHVMKEGRR